MLNDAKRGFYCFEYTVITVAKQQKNIFKAALAYSPILTALLTMALGQTGT